MESKYIYNFNYKMKQEFDYNNGKMKTRPESPKNKHILHNMLFAEQLQEAFNLNNERIKDDKKYDDRWETISKSPTKKSKRAKKNALRRNSNIELNKQKEDFDSLENDIPYRKVLQNRKKSDRKQKDKCERNVYSSNIDKNKEDVSRSRDFMQKRKPDSNLKYSKNSSSSFSVEYSTVLENTEKLEDSTIGSSKSHNEQTNIEHLDNKPDENRRGSPGINMSSSTIRINKNVLKDVGIKYSSSKTFSHDLMINEPTIAQSNKLSNVSLVNFSTQKKNEKNKHAIQLVSQKFKNWYNDRILRKNTHRSTVLYDRNITKEVLDEPNVSPAYSNESGIYSLSDIQSEYGERLSESYISPSNCSANKEVLQDYDNNSGYVIPFPNDLISNKPSINQASKDFEVNPIIEEKNDKLDQALAELNLDLEKLLKEQYLQNQNKQYNNTNDSNEVEEIGSSGCNISSKTLTNDSMKDNTIIQQTVGNEYSNHSVVKSSTEEINYEKSHPNIFLSIDPGKQEINSSVMYSPDDVNHSTKCKTHESSEPTWIKKMKLNCGNMLMMRNTKGVTFSSPKKCYKNPIILSRLRNFNYDFHFKPVPWRLHQIFFEDFRKTYESMSLSYDGKSCDPRLRRTSANQSQTTPPRMPAINIKSKPSQEQQEISQMFSNKNILTKKDSGENEISSLSRLCSDVILKNEKSLESIMKNVTPDQLFKIEYHNPCIKEYSDELWKKHCITEFHDVERKAMETWRSKYIQCKVQSKMKKNDILDKSKKIPENSCVKQNSPPKKQITDKIKKKKKIKKSEFHLSPSEKLSTSKKDEIKKRIKRIGRRNY